MKTIKVSGEIKSLTGVRGIAALVVAIHHFISKYYIDSFAENANNNWFSYMTYNYANHGYLMVELFFILSGFVLALSYDKRITSYIDNKIYKNFMIKRFNRIYPLYFFSTIMYFFIFNIDIIFRFDILLANFFFLELWLPKIYTLNNVSWSLCAEWFMYLLFPFMLLKKDYFKDKIYLLILFAIIIFILAPIWNTQKLYDSDVVYSVFDLRMSNGSGAFLRCLGSYIIGIAAYLVYRDKPKLLDQIGKNWYIFILLLFVFYGIDKSDIIIDLIFGVLILAMTQVNRFSNFLGNKVLYFLGLISYSIYLNHMIFLRVLNFSFKKGLWSDTDFNIGIGFCFFIVLTICSSWITYKIIEVPCNNWLNRRLNIVKKM